MKKLSKYFYVSKISLSNNLIYVWNFIVRNFFFIFIIYIMLMLWENIFSQKGSSIAGFTLNQMIWYLIVTEMITLSRSNVFQEVSRDVKNGNIAYMLNKPYNYIWYSFFNSLGEISVKLFMNLIIGIIIGFIYVGPLINFDILSLPLIAISLILGVFINFFIYISLSLTSFWLEENSAFFWIYSKLIFTLGGMLIPIDMFPNWLEKMAKYLPFAYVTYAPAKLAVNYSSSLFINTIIIQIVYLIVFITITIGIYNKGVRSLNVNGG